MLNRSSENRQPYIIPSLNILPLSMMLNVFFTRCSLLDGGNSHLLQICWDFKIMNECWSRSNAFSISTEIYTHTHFTVNVVSYRNWLFTVEPTLYYCTFFKYIAGFTLLSFGQWFCLYHQE